MSGRPLAWRARASLGLAARGGTTLRRRLLALTAFVACSTAGAALANDSSAELRQGGLVLVHNPGVEMRSEDLYISPKAVKVRYRFFNATARDLKVLVAFPMPDITTQGIDDLIAIPTQDPQNIMGFSARVEGKPVAARVEQRAVLRGVDRTALLKSLGVPLAPHLAFTGKVLDRLPKADQRRLLKLGLAQPDDFDAGKGWEHHLAPSWTLKTTYYWDQVFPARRELAVEHDYTPSVGGTSGTSLEADWFRTSPDYRRVERKYCIDQAFMAAVDKVRKVVGPQHQAFFEKRIEYVLSSGANWKSPIAYFRLVIDKERPDSLVSVCMTGVKKIGPTRFEIRRTNFRPDRDLSILLLEPAPTGF